MLVDVLPRILGVAGILVITVVAGNNVVPALAIGPNFDAFSDYEHVQARTAWRAARGVIGGSLEPLAVRAIRVEEIMDEAPLARTRCGPAYDHAALVRVQFYTAFGLPWSAMVVEACDERYAGVSRIRGGIFDAAFAWGPSAPSSREAAFHWPSLES